MTTPLVTVITPTYNHPETLVETVESVLRQTYARWEQLVVDDGSDLPAAEVLRHVKDPRVRVIRREHAGLTALSSIYNAARREAQGQLLAVLEDDDLWPPDKLALQVPAFDDPGVVLSWGRAQLIDPAGAGLGVLPNDRRALDLAVRDNDPPGAILREMLRRNIIPACTVMVRVGAVDVVGGFLGAGAPYVDYPTWLKIAALGRFAFHDGVVGMWRVHASQASATRIIEQETAAARIALDCYDALDAEARKRSALTRVQVVAGGGRRVAEAYLKRGRFRAAAGDGAAARGDFRQAVRLGRGGTLAKAVVALTLSSLGLDIEAAVRTAGRIPIKNP